MGFIDDLYKGTLEACENFYPPTEEYLRDSTTLAKCEEKLLERLSDDARSLFETFCTVKE